MKQVLIKTNEEIKKMLPETLKKDLQDDERICLTCHGLGVVAVHRPYGIKGDTNPEVKGKMFPYDHEALSFCPDCYNGVQSLCKYCGKPIKKGYINKCDCAEYDMEQKAIEIKKWEDTLNKAKEISECDIHTMLYCEESGEYFDTVEGFIDDWDANYEDEELPERLWITSETSLSFDASNVLEGACEDLHEDARENCDTKSLQTILDEYAAKQTGTETYFPSYEQFVRVER